VLHAREATSKPGCALSDTLGSPLLGDLTPASEVAAGAARQALIELLPPSVCAGGCQGSQQPVCELEYSRRVRCSKESAASRS
jgi:hypothetical protein